MCLALVDSLIINHLFLFPCAALYPHRLVLWVSFLTAFYLGFGSINVLNGHHTTIINDSDNNNKASDLISNVSGFAFLSSFFSLSHDFGVSNFNP